MFEIQVNHRDGSYRVYGERGGLARAGRAIKKALPESRRALVVTDEQVRPLYLKALAASLSDAGFDVAAATVAAGAEAKTVDHLARLYRELAAAALTGEDVVVAFGGGSVGDVAGFAAATFRHGLPWTVVPTTLRAQIDSCLGGKVGVDFDGVRDQVGTFYHPRAVVVDGELLATLPGKHLSAGLAEAVKYALLVGEDFFGFLEDNAATLLRAGPALDAVVERGLTYKAAALGTDEPDRRERHLLNLGRTLGAAFESARRTSLDHGEAVATGLVYTALLSELRGELATEAVIRLARLLRRFNLPTYLPTMNLEKTLAALAAGRRFTGGEIYMAIPRGIGRVIVEPVPLRAVAELLPQIHRLARSMT
jgi:3-dehydroquinate synthase